jgi:hypothetical protein
MGLFDDPSDLSDGLDPLDEEDFPLEDTEVDTTADAWCPYCGEPCELTLDPGGGAHQEYIEDCPVCCRPWRVTAYWIEGMASVRLDTEDD